MGYSSLKVIILVLNWNGWRDTLDCLDSLYRNDYPDYQVVLIDNNSEDGSLERIKEWAKGKKIAERDSESTTFVQCPLPYIEYDRKTAELGGVYEEEKLLHENLPSGIPHPLIIIQTGNNLGFAGGNNVGLRYAGHFNAEYVLLLNNDAMLRSRHTLSTMIGFMDTHTYVGACGGRLFYPDGSAQSSYGNFPTLLRALAFLFPLYKLLPKRVMRNVRRANVVPDDSIREPLPVDYPSGACFLVRKETIDDVGLLDERFFMYAEETDWCLRMKKHEWGRYYLPRAEVIHKYAGSYSSSSVKMNRYFMDSLFKYYRKNFTIWRLWTVAAGYALRSLYSTIHWTIVAFIKNEPSSLTAQDNARYWRFYLTLATVTMKDILRGKIAREQVRCHTRET
jgi:GT2 family glycosyltransferase